MKRRTQADRSAAATEKLIAATTALIGEFGVDGFSIADVADRAGVSRGLPGHHFKNKEGLVLAVAERIMKARSRHKVQGFKPLMDSLTRSIERAKQPTDSLRALTRLATAEDLPARVATQVQLYWDSVSDMYQGHLEAARKEGLVRRPLDCVAASRALTAAMIGQATLATRRDGKGLTAADGQAFLRLISTGLAGRDPSKGRVQRTSQLDIFDAADDETPEV